VAARLIFGMDRTKSQGLSEDSSPKGRLLPCLALYILTRQRTYKGYAFQFVQVLYFLFGRLLVIFTPPPPLPLPLHSSFQGLIYSRMVLNSLCNRQRMILNFQFSCFYLVSAGIPSRVPPCLRTQYMVPGIEPRASCSLGKHGSNLITPWLTLSCFNLSLLWLSCHGVVSPLLLSGQLI